MKITFNLNGKETTLDSPPLKSLLDILRKDLGLTGTKCGCHKGECNSCLVFYNEMLVNSCLVPAFRLNGTKVVTIEGFTQTKEYQTIEKAFLKMNITGCGFCIPGLILATEALLTDKPHPTRDEVTENLSAFLCLCSGYQQVVDAVLYVSELRRKKKGEK
jgi:aerobic carbon-monoxide dehydrogenase small subunit